MSMESAFSRTAPEAPRLPLVGNLHSVLRYGMWDFLTREHQRRGDYFYVRLGPRRTLVLAHPEGVEQVLSTHREKYQKLASYDAIRLLTGDGLLTLEGDAWRARRRLANPAFHKESIRGFVRSISSIAREAMAAWRWRIPNGGTLEMHHEMMRLTMEVVGETLFGQRMGEASGASSGRAFADALALLSDRGNSSVRLPLHVPTPGNLKLRKALAVLDGEVTRVLERARSRAEGPPTLLGMLLDARDEDTGKGLTDRELRDELTTLFLAGHETTALLLTWGFTLLAREPEVVERAKEEVDRVVGSREVTAEDVPKLVYLRRVVDEMLRLRTPTWSVARDAVEDDVLAGYGVRKGDLVLPAIFLVHRHPDFWPEAERFDPDRFTPERSKGRSHWAYLPFSLGPRICIGNIFAITEAVVLLACFLQEFDFSMRSPELVGMEAGITLRPKGPVDVEVRWRKR